MKRVALLSLLVLVLALPSVSAAPQKPGRPAAAKAAAGKAARVPASKAAKADKDGNAGAAADLSLEEKLALIHCSNSKESPFEAAAAGDLKTVRAQLRDRKADWPTADELGNTLLHLAAASSSPELVKFLLQEGGNPNAKNKDGRTPRELVKDEEVRQVLGGASAATKP